MFGLNALPFGASGSVAGFLRVSTAVFHVLTVGLGIWAGTFFDDFPILCQESVSKQTEQHVSMLLDLLGLRFAREGKKWFPLRSSVMVSCTSATRKLGRRSLTRQSPGTRRPSDDAEGGRSTPGSLDMV